MGTLYHTVLDALRDAREPIVLKELENIDPKARVEKLKDYVEILLPHEHFDRTATSYLGYLLKAVEDEIWLESVERRSVHFYEPRDARIAKDLRIRTAQRKAELARALWPHGHKGMLLTKQALLSEIASWWSKAPEEFEGEIDVYFKFLVDVYLECKNADEGKLVIDVLRKAIEYPNRFRLQGSIFFLASYANPAYEELVKTLLVGWARTASQDEVCNTFLLLEPLRNRSKAAFAFTAVQAVQIAELDKKVDRLRNGSEYYHAGKEIQSAGYHHVPGIITVTYRDLSSFELRFAIVGGLRLSKDEIECWFASALHNTLLWLDEQKHGDQMNYTISLTMVVTTDGKEAYSRTEVLTSQ